MNSDLTEKFDNKIYVTKLKAALGAVLDLASQNMLDERDVEGRALKRVVKEQQDDMATVVDLYGFL
jgi:uncharacterized protein YicC (UPF0701 family)